MCRPPNKCAVSQGMPPVQRKELAQKAAAARWANGKGIESTLPSASQFSRETLKSTIPDGCGEGGVS